MMLMEIKNQSPEGRDQSKRTTEVGLVLIWLHLTKNVCDGRNVHVCSALSESDESG